MRSCSRCGGERKTRYATDFTDLCDQCALTDLILDVNWRLLKGRLRGESSAPLMDPDWAVEALLAEFDAGKSFVEAVLAVTIAQQYTDVVGRFKRLLLPA